LVDIVVYGHQTLFGKFFIRLDEMVSATLIVIYFACFIATKQALKELDDMANVLAYTAA